MMTELKVKCSSIAAFTAIKTRHRDIIQELKTFDDEEELRVDLLASKKQILHTVMKTSSSHTATSAN